jgi:hypothetical protein
MLLSTIDFFINAVPVKASHFVFTMAVGIVYTIVNLITTKALGEHIYPQMKWESAQSLAFSCSMIFLSVLIFMALYFCQKKKLIMSGYDKEVKIL